MLFTPVGETNGFLPILKIGCLFVCLFGCLVSFYCITTVVGYLILLIHTHTHTHTHTARERERERGRESDLIHILKGVFVGKILNKPGLICLRI